MVRLDILDKGFVNFSDYTISLKYNTIASTFTFSVLNFVLDDLFGYPRCEILKDGFPILSGVVIIPQLTSVAEPTLSKISGYTVAGILDDVEIPVDSYPLQSDNLNLSEIAEKYTNPFDVNVAFTQNVEKDMFKAYPKAVAENTQTIKDYLTELASQRGIILTHNELGSLVFTRVDVDALVPVEQFTDDTIGKDSMELQVNGQQLHNKITVIREASVDNPDAGEATVQNPYCPIYRPKTIITTTSDVFDVEKAARKALSDELTAIKLVIQTKRFVKPGNLVRVQSEKLRILKPVDWFVEECEINGTTIEENYTLTCVLKDVYSDNTVTNIFN
jgi:prophage tail gpP-like protein